ncbi:leucine--tRNA ligase, partial [Candidatus Pacearchaeota archaeon]|nr:leucine--tRNA ligase [Candidatus Pacearchaeota archaeon]
KCKTVLANEQVHGGKCWRHENTNVDTKFLEQWFIKTTAYADELLDCIDGLEWPNRIKVMQKNWIGKSFGTEINFKINGEIWPIFTTRPDTIYGVTFMIVSAQHPNLKNLVVDKQKKDVDKFLHRSVYPKTRNIGAKKVKVMDENELEKEGVFTGSYAINPINNEKVPVWVGNFVVADYGSGMVMGVPAHDQRDFEFAKKYGIGIEVVIVKKDSKEIIITKTRTGNISVGETLDKAYTGEGILCASEEFNGLDNEKAKEEITKYLSKKKLGKKDIQYKLKDWLVSRQRYWGTPIPVVYCDKCGIVPVLEKDLPVVLPEKIQFGKGNPLKNAKDWINTICPKCKRKAKRETDTMDTFFDSSWYFLRYCDNKNSKIPFDKKKIDYWMPVDQYIGGAEHACMHLIYARFFIKALRDLGFVKFDEPFTKLFNQGMLHGADGNKMSKSLGNVILPEEVSKKYGIDTARLFLVSIASPDNDIDWSEKGIEGSLKFIKKIMNYFKKVKIGIADPKIESKLNKVIKEVTNQIKEFKYNLAVIQIRNLFNSLPDETSKEVLEKFLKLLHIFCPHITEELWSKLGNKSFISLEKWPVVDEKKIDENLEKQEKAVEQIIEDINYIKKLVEKKVSKGFIYVLPKEREIYFKEVDLIHKKTNLDIEIFAVNDKQKHDPENKSKKAKPGKPAIYLE